MSYENFVRVKVVTPVAIGATSFAIVDAVAPQKLPPTDGGYLVLCDSPGNPSWIEVIKYTARSGLGITGVTRGQEGTSAVAWTGNVYAFQALMAGEANLIQTTLAGKQAEIAPGATGDYWRGDKTWRDFFTDVRAATLSGLSTSSSAALTAADTVLSGLGKLQRQLSDAMSGFEGSVRSTVLTGYTAGANTVLAATDSVLAAFGKVQGQLNAKAPLASPALTGVPTAPTAAAGTNTLQVSSTAFVQQELAALINGAPGALDQLSELAAAMGNDANFAATMTTALAGKEPAIASDLVSKFFSGTKTWRDLPTDVRACILTGLSVASEAVVVAGDSLLVALGKLQAQVTSRAMKGANSDITSLSALSTALSIAQGGTGGTSQATAQSALGLVKTSSGSDTTAGRLLKVGDFGVGAILSKNSVDTNTILDNGEYYLNSCSNTPGGSNGYLTVANAGTGYTRQEFTHVTTGVKYARHQNAGSWGVWKAFAMAGESNWQDVSGSRAIGATYTNTTGKDIQVTALFGPASAIDIVMLFLVDGQTIYNNYSWRVGAYINILPIIIPAGSTYQVTASSGTCPLYNWKELR